MSWIIGKLVAWFGDGYMTDIARTVAKALAGWLVLVHVIPTTQLDSTISVMTSIIVGALTLLLTLLSSWKDKTSDIAKVPPSFRRG
jgi:ABC-type lipoprotein release transport system permease subunit